MLSIILCSINVCKKENFLLDPTVTIIFENGDISVKQKQFNFCNDYVRDEIILIGANGLRNKNDTKYEWKIEPEINQNLKG